MGINYFNGNWHTYIRHEVSTLSQDRVANTTTARVSLYIGNDPGGYEIQFDPTYGAYMGVQLAGQNKYLKIEHLFIKGSERYVGSVDFTFTHDEDGQATRKILLWSGSTSGIKYGGWYLGSIDTSFTETFAKIPRMSKVASVTGTRELGQELTINLDRKVDTFTHQVWYKVWGSDWYDLGTGLGTTIKFTPKPEEAKRNINVVSNTFDIRVRTFDGDKQIGIDEYSVGWNIGLPANTQPKLQTVELTDTAKATKDIVGKNMFVQTFSEMVCRFVGFEGTYGSTIKSYYAEVVGQKNTITKDNATFSYFKNYGDFQVQAFVTDSRGLKSNVVTVPIKVIEYFPPALNFEAFRSGGDLQTITVRRNVKIAPIIVNGVQKNTLNLKFKVKPANNGYFTDNAGAGITSKVVNTLTNSNADLSGIFRADASWIVEGTISDAYASFTFTAPIVGPEEVVQCRTPKGTGFGKVWERGTLDVAGDVYVGGYLAIKGNQHSVYLKGDANTMTRSGLFYVDNLNNAPYHAGYLTVHSHSENDRYVLQEFTPFNSTTKHIRKCENGTWSDWTNVWKPIKLENGWIQVTEVAYRISNDGSIQLKGTCKNTVSNSYVGIGGTIFWFPKNTKINTEQSFPAITDGKKPCSVYVSTIGEFMCGFGVSRGLLCLDGITVVIK